MMMVMMLSWSRGNGRIDSEHVREGGDKNLSEDLGVAALARRDDGAAAWKRVVLEEALEEVDGRLLLRGGEADEAS
jgi:hypothetical protein